MRRETLIFACAGAAHCGQATNRAAVNLTASKDGQAFCVAAVAAGVEDKMERARSAAWRVAIDGCDDHCARLTLEDAGLDVDFHVVATDLGIGRKANGSTLEDDAAVLTDEVRAVLSI